MDSRLINDSELPGFCLEHHFGLGSIFLAEGMQDHVVTCDLLVRDLPPNRNFLMAGGLEAIIFFIKNLKYEEPVIQHLLDAKRISLQFAEYLRKFSFSGDIYALPEGTVHFPGTPIIRVTAPIIEAHLITDQLIALANIDTLLLSKLARVSLSAGKAKCSIGFVRAHGIDAGWRAMRNSTFFYNMGFNNVSASRRLGLGATASAFNANHAFIKSFSSELEALRAATRNFPDAISPMFDTYNIKTGMANVIKVADELKSNGKSLASVVVDSGDLSKVAKFARKKLDNAGHKSTKIVIAGNIDEFKILKFSKQKVPADVFLIVTEVVTSADAPKLEMVYKVAQVESKGSLRYTAKLSKGKVSLPGKKQVFRVLEKGKIKKDIIGLDDETLGEALLVPIFVKGKLVYQVPNMEQNKAYVLRQLSILPEKQRNLLKQFAPPLETSKKLNGILNEIKKTHG